MTTTFQPGDRVQFISKFGDLVTGVYIGVETIPGVFGPIDAHCISSHNAFGEEEPTATRCLCPLDKLERQP